MFHQENTSDFLLLLQATEWASLPLSVRLLTCSHDELVLWQHTDTIVTPCRVTQQPCSQSLAWHQAPEGRCLTRLSQCSLSSRTSPEATSCSFKDLKPTVGCAMCRTGDFSTLSHLNSPFLGHIKNVFWPAARTGFRPVCLLCGLC